MRERERNLQERPFEYTYLFILGLESKWPWSEDKRGSTLSVISSLFQQKQTNFVFLFQIGSRKKENLTYRFHDHFTLTLRGMKPNTNFTND